MCMSIDAAGVPTGEETATCPPKMKAVNCDWKWGEWGNCVNGKRSRKAVITRQTNKYTGSCLEL